MYLLVSGSVVGDLFDFLMKWSCGPVSEIRHYIKEARFCVCENRWVLVQTRKQVYQGQKELLSKIVCHLYQHPQINVQKRAEKYGNQVVCFLLKLSQFPVISIQLLIFLRQMQHLCIQQSSVILSSMVAFCSILNKFWLQGLQYPSASNATTHYSWCQGYRMIICRCFNIFQLDLVGKSLQLLHMRRGIWPNCHGGCFGFCNTSF